MTPFLKGYNKGNNSGVHMKQAILLISIALLAEGPATAVDIFSIQEIPTLGGQQSGALGINNLGQVVGYAFLPSGSFRAIVWNGATLTNLGTLGGDFSSAYDINDAGRIVGQSEALAFPSVRFGFYIDPGDAQQTSLANLPNTFNAVVRTVNAEGRLAGVSATIDEVDAVTWEGSGQIVPLDSFLDEPFAQGDVWDSSDGNVLVGWSKFFDTGTGYIGRRAAMWTNGGAGAIVDLGTLGGSGSEARGVNNLGQIVGMSGVAGEANGHAFLYKGGNMQDLGDLGPGVPGVASWAQGINDSSQVVGFAQTAPGSTWVAFLWEEGTMYDLNDLIPPGSGWVLERAEAINELGQIVGIGISPSGFDRGFVLTPASPGGPGRVPDGSVVAGTPLQLRRDDPGFALEWDASCSVGATDYAVYRGEIGDPTSMMPLTCSTGGALSEPLAPGSVDSFFVVVPLAGSVEGSYGLTSTGTERPRSLSACVIDQTIDACLP